MRIREASEADWESIWPFFERIVRAGDTYTYDRDMSFEQGRAMWMVRPPGRTVVAVDDAGVVLGSAKMGPNYGGGGAHVANGSFMVDPAHSGKGVGRALGEFIVEQARADGYRAMVFNAVVESNSRAVKLWQWLGFDIMATLPECFVHPSLGPVGLHVMHRRL